MAWEHFTDWLEPGQMITKAQRDELLDAIEERIKAIDGRWGWSDEMAAIKDSGLATLRVHYEGWRGAAESGEESDLLTVIFFLAEQHYIRGDDPSTNVEPWDSFGIFYAAAEDLGYIADAEDPDDQAVADKLIDSGDVYAPDQAKFWNIMRRAVQLLQVPILNLYGDVHYLKQVEDPGTIEEVQAATEIEDAFAPFRLAGFDFDLFALRRFTMRANLAPSLYSDYTLWAATDTYREFGGGSYRWKVGSASPATFTYPWAGAGYVTIVEELGEFSENGEIVIEVDTPNYYVGGPDDASMVRVTWTSAGVFGQPTFTHSYEEILPP
ncbi:MAG: hypothetical protein C0518_05615 [Opitutus sp.]|nr:hypothetical protein [Opitutus sp.]